MRSAELVRYAISGGASALTHLGVGLLLAEGLDVRPAVASSVGFVASILISYGLQRTWVFGSTTGHLRTGPRFLAVTAVAGALNAAIMTLDGPYVLVQGVALVVIPVVNYALNSHWTFRVP
ncbi:GtrA family protein [Actinoplanes bogorensis]|uniref:GtrA family protein n=1 Tax=Paractinoplanes bogorensis TaxID=1610840 RepID=A0ABS5YFH2_9ACTN|nr:GtrA family protein [Actinoplanes bogorensis]MBU2662157.1 GtrA family protein [Actinoplanes bogorensis]